MTDATAAQPSPLDTEDDSLNQAAHDAAVSAADAVDDHGDDLHTEHWADLTYVKLALALAVITAAEVAMSYSVDFWGAWFIPILLLMMAVKFFAVVLFFMHLKFDSRVFSLMFYMGLGLAVSVYVAALFTFQFFGK